QYWFGQKVDTMLVEVVEKFRLFRFLKRRKERMVRVSKGWFQKRFQRVPRRFQNSPTLLTLIGDAVSIFSGSISSLRIFDSCVAMPKSGSVSHIICSMMMLIMYCSVWREQKEKNTICQYTIQ